jgi:hypothetical protein
MFQGWRSGLQNQMARFDSLGPCRRREGLRPAEQFVEAVAFDGFVVDVEGERLVDPGQRCRLPLTAK